MIWQELVINRHLTKPEIMYVITKIFRISLNNILVTDDMTQIEVGEQVQVICEQTEINGNFPMRIAIYLQDERLIPSNDLEMAGKFCDEMNCECLISDDNVNPYRWILVQDLKTWQPVYLDPIKLDEREEFFIQKICEDT